MNEKPKRGDLGYHDYLWQASVADLTPEERKDREKLVENWKCRKQERASDNWWLFTAKEREKYDKETSRQLWNHWRKVTGSNQVNQKTVPVYRNPNQSSVSYPVGELVYFVLDLYFDLIKIGYTKNFSRRFREHQLKWGEGLQLLGVIDGDRKSESELHKMFSKFQVKLGTHREWFYAEKPIYFFIKHFCKIKTPLPKQGDSG